MYNCPFSRSDGAGNATTRNTRGLTRSVMALIVPPLPAASRPSKTTTTRSPACLTQSCNAQSSTCSLRSSFSYSLRFIDLLPWRDFDRRRACAGGRRQSSTIQHVETIAGRSGRHPLQCDVLQYLVAAGVALLGDQLRGVFHRLEDRRLGRRLGVSRPVQPSRERLPAFLKAGRDLPVACL